MIVARGGAEPRRGLSEGPFSTLARRQRSADGACAARLGFCPPPRQQRPRLSSCSAIDRLDRLGSIIVCTFSLFALEPAEVCMH